MAPHPVEQGEAGRLGKGWRPGSQEEHEEAVPAGLPLRGAVPLGPRCSPCPLPSDFCPAAEVTKCCPMPVTASVYGGMTSSKAVRGLQGKLPVWLLCPLCPPAHSGLFCRRTQIPLAFQGTVIGAGAEGSRLALGWCRLPGWEPSRAAHPATWGTLGPPGAPWGCRDPVQPPPSRGSPCGGVGCKAWPFLGTCRAQGGKLLLASRSWRAAWRRCWWAGLVGGIPTQRGGQAFHRRPHLAKASRREGAEHSRKER